MTRSFQRVAATSALLVALLTSGCSDLPVVGPAIATIKPFLQVLAPVIGPIKGMLGMDSNSTTPSVTPSPLPRARRPLATAAQAGAASASVNASQSLPTEAQFARATERNKEFDRLRTTGLMQLYGGETKMAIDSFEKAAQIRPNDAHIRELLELAKNPPRTGGGMGGDVSGVPEGFLQ